ncbi:carbohydrate sulfotransferase 15-like isoform X2 [Antedon mediterranea]|uniref:carbohydrate sulfotransferase 15-like isoform X2 n=1 Tax=Antedon mediterranea TaxID=105859 RepID=UPI003AF93DA5
MNSMPMKVFLAVTTISLIISLLFFMYSMPCTYQERFDGKCKYDRKNGIHSGKAMYSSTLKRIKEFNKELFVQVPRKFLKEYKNPCWYNNSDHFICLPYFYIVGFPKCGTTDIWDKIIQHPHVVATKFKEYQWWARRYERRGRPPSETMMGDASMTTGWYLPPSWLSDFEIDGELVATTADLIYALTPSAKIIFMLRDPIERLYSGYIFSRRGSQQKSAEDFHNMVEKVVKCLHQCMRVHTTRYCAYHTDICQNASTNIVDTIQTGMYVIFLRDWFKVFPRDQLHFILLDHWHHHPMRTLNAVYKFLQLDTVEDKKKILNRTVKNSRSTKDHLELGDMLPATRDILENFYLPFNNDLMDFVHIHGGISN